MNLTVKYNTNATDTIDERLTNVKAPEVVGNAFLQFANLDGSPNLLVPIGRLASVKFEHDLVQPATSIPENGKLNLVI